MRNAVIGRQNATLVAFVLPALMFFSLAKFIPALLGFFYALTDWNGINPSFSFVGLANFREILTEDANFWSSFSFTARYVLAIMVLMNAAALGLALMIENASRGRTAFRVIFYVPNMISMIIGGYMWNFIFTRVLPSIAVKFGLAFLDQSWIGDPRYSFVAIITVALWGGTGYLMLIYIAGLQSVPRELIEAALVDGASAMRRFARVTLPLMAQSFTICAFVTLNSAFQVFDVVFALTRGGPGRATEVMAINIYEEAFNGNSRFGYATAKSMVLFAIILLVTMAQLYAMKRKEVEQ